MNDWRERNERGPKAGAIAGLPALYAECALLASEMQRLGARLTNQQTKIANTLAAITGQDIPAALSSGTFTVQILLPQCRYDAIEHLIDAVQERWGSMSIDDALADIFEAGMTSMTLRLSRSDGGEND